MRAYLGGGLSLSLLYPLVCVCVRAGVCWCVHSGAMGHRGGGCLAGAAEPRRVQGNLHSPRHSRFRASAPGEEGPKGMDTPVVSV